MNDRNSVTAGDAAAGDTEGGQAAMTAAADSAANQQQTEQTQPERQAAAPAAASEPLEPQMGVQMVQRVHVGQKGQAGQQEQRVVPRRAASAEPHKRLAVAAVTVAAGGHAAPAAPAGDWQVVVRGRGRAARRQAAAASARGGPMAFILDAVRSGRAFDCTQCGELGLWQGPRCGGCEGTVQG